MLLPIAIGIIMALFGLMEILTLIWNRKSFDGTTGGVLSAGNKPATRKEKRAGARWTVHYRVAGKNYQGEYIPSAFNEEVLFPGKPCVVKYRTDHPECHVVDPKDKSLMEYTVFLIGGILLIALAAAGVIEFNI